MMLLKDVLVAKGNKVWSINADQLVCKAVETLVGNKIGAILVYSGKKIVGVISERDIMRECQSAGQKWGESKVQDVMTKRVIISKPEDTLEQAMLLMTQNRIRHLPVIDKGKLCGIVSIGDVVKSLLKDFRHENETLKDFIQGS